jgi:hypothetical protein
MISYNSMKGIIQLWLGSMRVWRESIKDCDVNFRNLVLGEKSTDVHSIVMDNQVKMALKLLKFRSNQNSPIKSPRKARESIGKKYRTGSQGLLNRNGSVGYIKGITKVNKHHQE